MARPGSSYRRRALVVVVALALLAGSWGIGRLSGSLGAARDNRTGPLITRGAHAQATVTPQSLPTVDARVTATPTPRTIVIAQPTPTSTPRPRLAAIPTPTAQVITIEGPPTPVATAAPTATPLPTPTPTPAPTATPVPTATPAPVLAPAPPVRIEFTAEDWSGGFYRGDGQAYGRPWVAIYGAASAYPRATLDFTLDATPDGPATLRIAGLDDEWAELNPLSLEVNGESVFEGPSPFLNWDGVGDGSNAAWTTVPFDIPAGLLRAGPNTIALANLSPAANFNAPPYVLVSDATLRLPGAGADAATSQTPVPIVPSTSTATFAAEDWRGGFFRGDSLYYGRPWTAVYGAASDYPQATLRFRLDRQPQGPATLTLTGLDDEWAELNPIAIAVNGEQIYSGPSPFLNWDGVGAGENAAWTETTFDIPAELLRSGRNEITVSNLSPSANFNAPPYILLAEATLDVSGTEVALIRSDGTRGQPAPEIQVGSGAVAAGGDDDGGDDDGGDDG